MSCIEGHYKTAQWWVYWSGVLIEALSVLFRPPWVMLPPTALYRIMFERMSPHTSWLILCLCGEGAADESYTSFTCRWTVLSKAGVPKIYLHATKYKVVVGLWKWGNIAMSLLDWFSQWSPTNYYLTTFGINQEIPLAFYVKLCLSAHLIR